MSKRFQTRKGEIQSREEQNRLISIITAKYPEKVNEARQRLCANCAFLNSRECRNLCPITTEGRDCPYFNHKISQSPSASETGTRYKRGAG